jgi:phosphatidylglycerol lysyltransferase
MEHLLIKYGYLLLFFGIALEGETFLIAAAILAHQGIFHLHNVIFVAVAANTITDQVYYALARAYGRGWLVKRFGENPRFEKGLQLMERHGRWLLLASRYAFGFRILVPAACGALGMPLIEFIPINIVAGIIWAIPTAYLGFYLGRWAEQLLQEAYRYETTVVVIALALFAGYLAIRHLRKALPWKRLEDLHVVVPIIVGLMGVINLLSAIRPRSPWVVSYLREWLPLEVTQRSRPLMLFAGLALLQVTRNLSRRKALAWYVAVGALLASIFLHITRALDFHHSMVALLLLAYLIYFRHRFNARTDPVSLKLAFVVIPMLLGLVCLYGWLGLTHQSNSYLWESGNTPFQEAFRSGILIVEPHLDPLNDHAARFLGSLQIAGWLARLYILILLLRPVILRSRLEAPIEMVVKAFQAHSRYSLSAFALQEDKNHLLLQKGKGLVAYAVRSGVALSCGDPLAADSDLPSCIEEYLAHCRKNSWIPCIYEAAEARLGIYSSFGMRSLKMAEEALIDLPAFNLAGGSRANLRAMVNKVNKSGVRVRLYDRANALDAFLDEQLEEISEEWLAEKKLGELGFSLGIFALEGLHGIPVFVCEQGEQVLAFVSWLPYKQGKAVVLDLMRKRKDTPAGTMDVLLAHSLLSLQKQGFLEASLANAPLANVNTPSTRMEKGVNLLFENLNQFYGYKNLFQFKKKFAPRWEGRYLIFPSGADLPKVAFALSSVHHSESLWQLLWGRK